MNKFKMLLATVTSLASFTAMASTAQAATTVSCVDSAAAVCSFDGFGGGWNNVKVAKKTTATHSFALALTSLGILNVTISSTYLDLVSLSFGGVTLTGILKGEVYSFAVTPSATPQLLTVVMKNTKTKDYGYSSQLDFAAIPEPTAWGLMIGGLGIAGGALRRRRSERVATA